MLKPWVKTHRIIKWLFSNYIWSMPATEKKVYLTFDDGPIPEVTEWVLHQLSCYGAKATFFCIGDNIRKHPDIYHKVIAQHHAIGNHTFHHLKGWNTSGNTYTEDVAICESLIQPYSSYLFRPPYGKITPKQSKQLRKKGYKIIMWDVLSRDFDTNITPERCLNNVLSHVTPGSIIVFHDSIKAFKNLEYALPRTLAFLKEKGYSTEKLF